MPVAQPSEWQRNYENFNQEQLEHFRERSTAGAAGS
jgi:hypothetical protein